ncbi:MULTISPECIES: lipoprotein LpqH [unclassified Actinomyces]|uniref:lipoprotein LpqH n=1 Tax=unclassified Actinomyces TaxID=2609248 RepID=UPI00137ADDEF|nr:MULTISPECIES: lipoprotein LpqH [unclassified Actinomyces]MBW3069499.1 lipoprotein LpqH [Actinomyces sp. 594]NDR53507.1 lipoprotein LpqH [Actinomyces sp. 565]
MKTPLLKTTTTAAALVLVLGLGACGSNSSSDAEQSASPAVADSATAAEGGNDSESDPGADAPLPLEDVKVGGSFTGTLDGEPFEIENAGVACGSQDGQTTIGVGPTDSVISDAGVRSVSLAIDDASSEVRLITIVPGDDASLNYTNIEGYRSQAGDVQVEVSEKTYTVTGEAAPSGSTETKSIDFVITCP